MTFTEINNYIKNNRLERKYNGSFNQRGINSPKTTFYSVAKMEEFLTSNQNLSYGQYFNFLSGKFQSKGHDNFKIYLKSIVDIWKKRENNFDIDENEALYYLAKKFIIDPVNGKRSEISVKDNLKKVIEKELQGFTISEPTPEEDMNDCWDFKLSNGDLTFYIQNKPDSFFKGLNKTTTHSANKIRKASLKNNHPIFFSRYNEKKQECEVCIPNQNSYQFKPIQELKISTQSNLMIQSKKVTDILSGQFKNNKKRKL